MEYLIELGNYNNEQSLHKLIACLKSAFPKSKKFTAEFLKWQYLDNPNGEVVSFNAWTEDGIMAAHYATIPIRMIIGGKIEKGLLSLNTATHPDHQGKGLFTKLANTTYDYAKDNGFKFVIGVANANSTHGFLKKLKFYLVSPLIVKVGVGDAYKKEVGSDKNRVFYDKETMAWRLKCPQFKYTSNGNTIYGSIDKPLFHTSVGRLPENVSREDLGLMESFDMFNLYIGIGADLGGFYVNLPKFVKRSPFNLVFRDLTEGGLPVITKDKVFFQLIDFDVA